MFSCTTFIPLPSPLTINTGRWVSSINLFVSVCLSVCLSVSVSVSVSHSLSLSLSPLSLSRPRGLTFTWWGRYGSCLRHEPTELAHSFCFVPVSISVFIALSTVFHSLNSPDNFLLSHSVLPVLLVLSTICLFMKVSFRPDIIPSG